MHYSKEKLKNKILKLTTEDLSEEEEDTLMVEIDNLSPDPYISGYVFGKEYEDLTVDEIVEKAFSYQPIILGDQSKDSSDT